MPGLQGVQQGTPDLQEDKFYIELHRHMMKLIFLCMEEIDEAKEI